MDNEGRILIGKKVAISITLILLILGGILSIAVDANSYKDKVDIIENEYISEKNQEGLYNVINIKIENIENDIKEIKEDLDYISKNI